MPDTPNPARGAKPSADRASLTLTPYLTPVYSFCFRLLNDATAAEDAAQETFLDAVKIWDRFVPPPTSTLLPSGNPVGGCAKDPRLQWLLAIAARRALNIRRQAVRFNPATEPAMEPTHEETPSAAAEQAETLSRLDAALCELPADQRQAVVLHHVAGMTQAEIAQSMALPPRTVSHRISDGLAALRARLERTTPAVSAGGTASFSNPPRTAEPSAGALGLLLVALPPVTAPASLAARVLTHPQILAWSSSSTVATASTATAGSAGTAPVPVANSAGAATSTMTTKGATIMSSKLMLAASAAVLAAAFTAWGTGALDPAPRDPLAAEPLAVVKQAAVDAPIAAAVPVLPVKPAADGPADPNATPVAPAVPVVPQLTPAELEAAYVKNLTAEQAAARAELAKAFGAEIPAANDGPVVGNHSQIVTTLNSSVGMFELEHRTSDSRTTNEIQLKGAQGGSTAPFEWNNFKVSQASAQEQEAGLFSQSSKMVQITSCGRQLKTVHADGTIKIDTAGPAQRLLVSDLWPSNLPARYDVKTVLDRVGLALIEQEGLATLLAAAEKADHAFVVAALGWEQAKTNGDKSALAVAAANGWQAGQALTTAQWDICKALEKYLQDTQSGPTAWAILSISGAETTGGLSLPVIQIPLSTQTSTSTMTTGGAGISADAPMPKNRAYKLESGGETLAHLAQVVNQNPASGGTVAIDPAVAKITIDGTVSGTTLDAVLTDLAKLGNVDCKADGANHWKLVAKPVPGATEGF